MSAAALTRARPSAEYDVLRDSRHRDARAAREQADWLAWLELGGTAARTVDQYERDTAVLLRMFPDTAFVDFDDGHLLHALREFPGPSRRVRSAPYKNWFRWGIRTRRLTSNPCDLLPDFKKPPVKLIDVFTEAEETALCALPLPDGPLMAVLFDGGLRKQEAIMLTERRCNLNARRLILKEGAKGGKQRVIPMSDRLAGALADLILLEGLKPGDHLWYDRVGGPNRRVRRTKPIQPSAFHRWWGRCLDDARVEYRKPHTTRHTFATRWRHRGLPLDDIQLLLGHASIRTTSDLYVHTKVEDVARRMEELVG